jgi:hypothetical protein
MATRRPQRVIRPSRRNNDTLIVQDPRTGKVTQKIAIKNEYEGAVWDTVAIPAGAGGTTAGTTYNFFRDIQNKEIIDTNMSSARRLLSGSRLEVHYVGLYFPLAMNNTLLHVDAFKKVVDNTVLEIRLNRLRVALSPSFMNPTGFGMVGQSTRTDTDIMALGVPSTAAIRRLLVPQIIESEQDIQATLEFQARAWDAVIAAVPNLESHVHCKLILKGIMFE